MCLVTLRKLCDGLIHISKDTRISTVVAISKCVIVTVITTVAGTGYIEVYGTIHTSDCDCDCHAIAIMIASKHSH